MRVLHVTDCYLPGLGGIEVHVSDLVAHQRMAGDDAEVVTIAPGPTAYAGVVPDPAWVRRVGGTARSDAPSLRSADLGLCRLLETRRPDVAHVHVSMLSPFATLAARRTSSAGVPTLVTVHSMWDRLGPLPALVRIVLRLRGWPIVWSAVSDAAAQPLREMLGPEIAVAVLPNAVDPALWQPRQRLADPTETAVVLISVMRLTRIKRTIPLARMLGSVRAAVPDDVALRAVIVGEGPRRMALERFLARHRMTDWVELPGRLDRGTVRERLATADCFVAPAKGESFGIAALEARAVGLPVIASRRSGVGEFVRDGREGLLAGDDASMVRAITRLITDRELREQIRGHNERVPIDHDWTTALLRTQRLYHRAAQAAGTVTPAASGAGHAEHERRADRVVG